jgi:LmeA-like phospholipid-binding
VALVLAVPVLLLVLAQAILPTLAARLVRDRIKKYGDVQSVSVSAWPAVELLWGKADSASATAISLSVTAAQMAKLTWESRGVHDLDIAVARLDLKVPGIPSPVVLRDVKTRKRGASMTTQATLTQTDLTAALPSGFTVQPLASGDGQIEVHASGGLFGVQASISALVKPLEGRLVAEPQGSPLAGLATVTLFSDPHLKMESVGVRVQRGQPLTYGLSLRASLR